MTGTEEARLALRSLSERYASAVDRRDPQKLVAVFTPDARLRVFNPAGAETPVTVRRGHDDIGLIPNRLAHYEATFHLIGSALYEIDGNEATGEVYCVAHHLEADGAARTNYVMYIRYRDTYLYAEETWRIVDRRLFVDWTERRPANPAGL